MSKDSRNPRGFSGRTIIKIFFVYWAFACMFATLLFFAMGPFMGPVVIGLLGFATLAIPGVATFLHVRKGKKNNIDEIADRMP